MPLGMRLPSLPLSVQEAGIRAFGSAAACESALNNTVVETLRSLNGKLRVKLASMKGDKSVNHLRQEMGGDRYGVTHSNLHSSGDPIVVDVGANLGDFTLAAAMLYPHVSVLAVEPAPPTFFYLVLNLHLNKVRMLTPSTFGQASTGGVLPLHAALGGAPSKPAKGGGRANANRSTVLMHYPVGRHDSQLAMTAHDGLAPRGGWRSQRVPLVYLPDFLDQRGVRKVRLFKVDCEGCEWQLLPSLRSWLLPMSRATTLLKPRKPKIEKLVGELHAKMLEPDFDFEARRKTGRPIVRPEVDDLFMTVRVLVERGCPIGLPGRRGMWGGLGPC